MKLTRRQQLFKTVFFRNWDEGIDWFAGVVERKDCDLATALVIYWFARPSYYHERYDARDRVPDSELGTYDLVRRLEALVADGAFSSLISFDPGAEDLVPNLLGAIPAVMAVPSVGKVDYRTVLYGDASDDEFFNALCEGDVATVKRALDEGRDPASKVKSSVPIAIACNTDERLGVFDLLVEHGVQVLKKYDRDPLMHRAAAAGAFAIVDRLVELGQDINAKGEWGRTALHYLAMRTPDEYDDRLQRITNGLLERGADPHRQDSDGSTPLDYAKDRSNASWIQQLTALQADEGS